ncbi:MAG: branched-chain amino acid ABC transporter substrate-binding protein [Acetobacteraceae bacterium]
MPIRLAPLAALALAFALPQARAETIRIAYIDPLSGSLAATGQLGEQHFRFAIDRANAAQAAGPGRTFELVALDNEVSPEKSLTLLRKAIDDGIHYVTQGNGSSVAFALSDAIAKNNRRAPNQAVMFLNYAAVDPGLTNDKCNWWHFRFDADSDMKMRALSDYLVSQPAVKKVYVFNPDYSFGQSVEKAAKDMLANRRPDLQIVGTERVPLGKVKDFTPYIQKFQAAGADAVLTGNWGADLTLLLKAAQDAGYKGTFFTYYLGSADVIAGVGTGGEGYAQISEYHANLGNPDLEKLAADFEAKYNQKFYYWRVLETIDMLAAAMKQADSTDPAKVGQVLATMHTTGPTGEATMREDNHQLLQPMFVAVLKPGMKYTFPQNKMGFTTISRIEPEAQRLPTTCKFQGPS